MPEKVFLITVDTEGDDLWHWHPGKQITTNNIVYIPRFQELCEKYGFKPVYFTDYEMVMDDRWVSYASEKARQGKCEIGMHLHGWNTPPEYPLENMFGGDPYVTEYPEPVIREKVKTMINLLKERFGEQIVSHRSGRWATNDAYFRILAEEGIVADCSVTPQLDLSGIAGCSRNCGNDYRKVPKGIHRIHPRILEIPMTTRKLHHACFGSLKQRLKTLIFGDEMWLRPISKSLDKLKYLTERVEAEQGNEYLQFMVHSSELMPGGSVFFTDAEAVEKMYEVMDGYFAWLAQRGYRGQTVREFVQSREEIWL